MRKKILLTLLFALWSLPAFAFSSAIQAVIATANVASTCSTGLTFNDASWTEVDSASNITLNQCDITVTSMQRDANSSVYKDYGAAHFGSFEIWFDVTVSSIQDTALAIFIGVGDLAAMTHADGTSGADGMYAYVLGSGTTPNLYLTRNYGGGDASAAYAMTTNTTIYCKIIRDNTGNSSTLVVYSSAGNRTSNTSPTTLSIGHVDATGRYLTIVGSRDSAPTDTPSVSLKVENVTIVSP